MPYKIIRDDLANLKERVDAIVSPAHPNHTKKGQGVEQALHEKAGIGLLAARTARGELQEGDVVATGAFGLNTEWVIHTRIAPWINGGDAEKLLRQSYDNSLNLALQLNCKSIAFPLLGTGNLGYPREIALRVAIHAFFDFCSTHIMDIFLVVFDHDSLEEVRKYQSYIEERISDADALQRHLSEYTRDGIYIPPQEGHQIILDSRSMQTAREDKINALLKETECCGFSKTLEALMEWMSADIGRSHSWICEEKGNLQRQHYDNNIYGKPNARCKKQTVLGYAVALELNVKQTTELLNRAGYVFSEDDASDRIIAKFLSEGSYTIKTINQELENNGQKKIGKR